MGQILFEKVDFLSKNKLMDVETSAARSNRYSVSLLTQWTDRHGNAQGDICRGCFSPKLF